MRTLTIIAAASLSLVGSASADPITDRQNLMKERGAIMQILGPIAQERQPFDAAVVMEQLEKLNANAQSVDVEALWPEGSQGESKSAPVIWERWDEFVAGHEKLATDVQAAVDANPQDLASFRTAFGPVGGDCGTCHETFRLP